MIHLTYTGSCSIDGQEILCSSMTSSIDQKVSFFDHTLGLRDKFSSDFESKGPSTKKGDIQNVQKRTYRYTPAIARANISGPIPMDGFQNIIDKAVSGEEISMKMTYYRKNSPMTTIGRAIISTLNMSVKPGDICNFTLDAVASEYTFDASGNTSKKAQCTNLVTWDAARITASPIYDHIESFNITINNPPVPIYTAQWTDDVETNGMMPQKIRIGMQEVTGTIGVYGVPIIDAPSLGDVDFSFNGAGKKLAVVFTNPSDTGNTGAYIRSINFTGTKSGTIWSSTTHSGCR